jgi:5-formyltetrahydrofolate cyclo-ligase
MTVDLDAMRRDIRAQRRDLPRARRAVADAAINRYLADLVTELGPTSVSSYLSTDGEPDLAAFHQECARADVAVAVPVMGADGNLEFRPLAGHPQSVNSAGIPEPQTTEVVELGSIDMVVTPLVAFDAGGNRVGRGGGWYDRALSNRRADQCLVGVAYHFQQRSEVPTHAGDVPLDLVVTDELVHRGCRRGHPAG